MIHTLDRESPALLQKQAPHHTAQATVLGQHSCGHTGYSYTHHTTQCCCCCCCRIAPAQYVFTSFLHDSQQASSTTISGKQARRRYRQANGLHGITITVADVDTSSSSQASISTNVTYVTVVLPTIPSSVACRGAVYAATETTASMCCCAAGAQHAPTTTATYTQTLLTGVSGCR